MIDVLVAGAGPTGLFTAAALARRGLSVRVVDMLPDPSPLSRAILVHARTLEILDGLGLARPLVERGIRLETIHLRSEGRTLTELGVSDLPTPFPFLLSVPQSSTEAVLQAHLQAQGVRVERPVRLSRFDARDDGVVAHLDPGGEVRCRWLVGCDGAHSAVRHGLALPFEGHAYEDRLILGDVAWSAALPRDTLHSWLSTDGFLAAFPLPPDRWRLIGVRAPGAPEDVDLAELQAMVTRRTEVGGTLTAPAWIAGFRIHARQAPRYRVGRVLLAGDAAHIHSPAGGQGMNLGLQDAHSLGWMLARVVRGGPEALLDAYEAERHPVAARTLRATDLVTRVGTSRSRLAQTARDAAGAWLAGLHLVRRRVGRTLAELDTTVAGSPIVVGDGGRAPHAWALASPLRPTAVVGGDPVRTRVYRAVLRAHEVDVVERDDVNGAVVVRPDGYVGFRGTDPVRLLAWVEQTLGTGDGPSAAAG